MLASVVDDQHSVVIQRQRENERAPHQPAEIYTSTIATEIAKRSCCRRRFLFPQLTIDCTPTSTVATQPYVASAKFWQLLLSIR
jgi:hypothetical protein